MKYSYTNLMNSDEFTDFFPEDNGLVRVELKNGGWVFINENGEIAGGHRWDHACAFSGGLARVMRGDKVGMVNAEGEIVVNPIWNAIEPVSEGYAVVKQGKHFGAVDIQGRLVIAPEWDELGACSEGRFTARKDGVCYILTADGELPVKAYEGCRYVRAFDGGTAVYMDDDSCFYGLVDAKGRLVHPPVWQSATRLFPGGKRYVIADGKLRLVRAVPEDE